MTSPAIADGSPKSSLELGVGIAMLGIVAMLIVPLPAVALDGMLAVSIAVSAIVFLTALYSERPTDFSIFPTLLLASTLLRLSLNIASTRLILRDGQTGPDAAGSIIQAFSEFVVGGDAAVGVVVFLALVVINFVVITKGSGPNCRSVGSLQPRCDARQADEHRRRAELGIDHRDGGPS